MIQGAGLIFGVVILFVLVSGLVVLWRRGPADLDAWGLFVARVLRGERRTVGRPDPSNDQGRKGRHD